MSEYEAGRELDALVAKKVMGWTEVEMGSTGISGGVDPASAHTAPLAICRAALKAVEDR